MLKHLLLFKTYIFFSWPNKKCHATHCIDRTTGNGKLLSQTGRVAPETLRTEVDQKHVYRAYEEIARSCPAEVVLMFISESSHNLRKILKSTSIYIEDACFQIDRVSNRQSFTDK